MHSCKSAQAGSAEPDKPVPLSGETAASARWTVRCRAFTEPIPFPAKAAADVLVAGACAAGTGATCRLGH